MTIYLKNFQLFNSVEEMDLHVDQHIIKHFHEMSETDRNILLLIARYSCKYAGAAHLKAETIAKGVNKSVSTIRRSLRKLERLKIIQKVETSRKKTGGNGANILLILPYEHLVEQADINTRTSSEKPCDTSDKGQFEQKETLYSLKPFNKSFKNKRNVNAGSLDHSYTSDNVPKEFVAVVKPFFDSAKTIESYWRMVTIDTRLIKDVILSQDDITRTAISAFKQMIRKLKTSSVKNPIAYFTGTLKKKIDLLVSQHINFFEGGEI